MTAQRINENKVMREIGKRGPTAWEIKFQTWEWSITFKTRELTVNIGIERRERVQQQSSI